MGRARISATIITYNEEKNIKDCLESVKWVDEIVVVDAFSTDRTFEICQQYTDKVIQHPWQGHVEQKQFALDNATGDWIIALDADERLSDEAREEIEEILEKGSPDIDGYFLPRHSFYLGRWINHGGWYPDYKLRFFKRGKGRWGGKDPHDKIIIDGKTKKLKGKIIHYVYRDLSHQLKTVDLFSTISATNWEKEGKDFRLLDLFIRPPAKFFEVYVYKRGFLDGLPGFIIACVSSFYVFLKYAKLWELKRR